MNLTVNGKTKEFSDEVNTVTGLLNALHFKNPVRVAVEINKEIIEQSAFNNTLLNSGDCIEIVSFVGGG